MTVHSRTTASAALLVALAALLYCAPSGAEMQDNARSRAASRAPERHARPLGRLLTAERMTFAELGEVAKAFNANAYWHARSDELLVEANDGATIMILGETETVDDDVLATGHLITEFTRIKKGLLLNLGPGPVWVTPDERFDPIELLPGSLFGVGSHIVIEDGRGTDPNACSVSCVEGFWACCNCEDGQPCTCKCVREDSHGWTCMTGGEGSYECSISRPET
jgi:hypothetical protein